MNTLDVLLRAAAESPDDDLARLALADHLEESGDPRCLWARERDLWRWSRPDLADPLPRMLAALARPECADALVRGFAAYGPGCVDPLLARLREGEHSRFPLARVLAPFMLDRLGDVERLLRAGTNTERQVALSIVGNLGERGRPLLGAVLALLDRDSNDLDLLGIPIVVVLTKPPAEPVLAAVAAAFGRWRGASSETYPLHYLANIAKALGKPGEALAAEITAAAMAGAGPEAVDARRQFSGAGRLSGPEAERAHLADLASDSSITRRFAAASLAGLDRLADETVAALLGLAARPGEAVAAAPALARHAADDPRARSVVVSAVRANGFDDDLAWAAVFLNPRGFPELLPDAVVAVDAFLRGERAYGECSLRALAGFEGGIRLLTDRLASAGESGRQHLFRALDAADALPGELLPRIEDLLADTDVWGRRMGLTLLRKLAIPADDFVGRVVRLLSDPEAVVREDAANVLAQMPTPASAVPALERLLLDDVSAVRVAAISALVMSAQPEERRQEYVRRGLCDLDIVVGAGTARMLVWRDMREYRPEVTRRRDEAGPTVRTVFDRVLAEWDAKGGNRS